MKYLLEANLTIKHSNGNLERDSYALSYILKKLCDVRKESVYNDERDTYCKDDSSSVYELEIGDIYLNLDKSLVKSQDFFRRTLYRYDWMQVQIDKRGHVLSVNNLQYMKEQWQEIRMLLLNDYKGNCVEEYIATIDTQFMCQDMKTSMSRYFNFGLLFPLIPTDHKLNWQNNRKIELSEFDGICFNECIMYESVESINRKYSIVGKSLSKDECVLNNYGGYIIVPHGDIHPVEAQVEIDYIKKGININWCFKIRQD